MKHASFSEALKAEKLMVGKGGLPPPAALKAFQAERGQAALPNHELFSFESLSVSLCLRGRFLCALC